MIVVKNSIYVAQVVWPHGYGGGSNLLQPGNEVAARAQGCHQQLARQISRRCQQRIGTRFPSLGRSRTYEAADEFLSTLGLRNFRVLYIYCCSTIDDASVRIPETEKQGIENISPAIRQENGGYRSDYRFEGGRGGGGRRRRERYWPLYCRVSYLLYPIIYNKFAEINICVKCFP